MTTGDYWGKKIEREAYSLDSLGQNPAPQFMPEGATHPLTSDSSIARAIRGSYATPQKIPQPLTDEQLAALPMRTRISIF